MAPLSLQLVQVYWKPPPVCGEGVEMVCELPGTNEYVCGAVNVPPPSADTRSPVGDVSSVVFTNWITVTLSVFVLLVVSLSVQVQPTDTLLVSGDEVLEATFTEMVTCDDPPLAAIAVVLVQVTTCRFAEQDQPVPEKLA